MNIVVNVSDAKVSADPNDVIITYSLGSCIGVTVYDPVTRAGGMLHYQLPTASMDGTRAKQNPCMFADSGMVYLLSEIASLGVPKNRLRVKIAGGAEILNDAKLFSIGRRNHTAIRKILWQHGLLLQSEQVGGTEPRTLYLHLKDGVTLIKNNGQTRPL